MSFYPTNAPPHLQHHKPKPKPNTHTHNPQHHRTHTTQTQRPHPLRTRLLPTRRRRALKPRRGRIPRRRGVIRHAPSARGPAALRDPRDTRLRGRDLRLVRRVHGGRDRRAHGGEGHDVRVRSVEVRLGERDAVVIQVVHGVGAAQERVPEEHGVGTRGLDAELADGFAVGVGGDGAVGEGEREDELGHGDLDGWPSGAAEAVVERARVGGEVAGHDGGLELAGDLGAELCVDGVDDVVGEEGDGGAGVEDGGFGVVRGRELVGARAGGGGEGGEGYGEGGDVVALGWVDVDGDEVSCVLGCVDAAKEDGSSCCI